MIELSDAQARRLRMRGQRLLDDAIEEREQTVHGVVRDSGGLQAQDARAYPLSVRARLRGSTAADVVRARVEERSVVRGWYMRGTLHLVAAEDVAWLLATIGPATVRATASRRRGLGIDEDTYARALRLIRDALAAQGPLPRARIAALLREHAIEPGEQRALHILHRASLEGHVCQGPPTGGGADSAFALAGDWLGPGWRDGLPSPDAQLGELARRHLRAHAPADPRDLATWAGIPVPEARRAYELIAAELVEVRVGDAAAWVPASQRDAAQAPAPTRTPHLRLLPVFDSYLLGHRSRALIVAEEHAHHVLPGGGWLNPTVVVDGVARAVWSGERRREGLRITVAPYREWRAGWRSGLDAEVADVARFQGGPATWRLAGSEESPSKGSGASETASAC